MNEWQPIETAPKDGSRFIACNKLGFVVIARLINGKHFATDSWAGTNDTVPVVWMPLPDPQKE